MRLDRSQVAHICATLTEQIVSASNMTVGEESKGSLEDVIVNLSQLRLDMAIQQRPNVSDQALALINALVEEGNVNHIITNLYISKQSAYRTINSGLARLLQYARMLGEEERFKPIAEKANASSVQKHPDLTVELVKLWETNCAAS